MIIYERDLKIFFIIDKEIKVIVQQLYGVNGFLKLNNKLKVIRKY